MADPIIIDGKAVAAALRADVAKQMLGRTTLLLTDIALATGFSSSAHFSRVFGEIYGTPPSSIRRGLQ